MDQLSHYAGVNFEVERCVRIFYSCIKADCFFFNGETVVL